jgi:hypothetical protein
VTLPGVDLLYGVPPDTSELQTNLTSTRPVTFDLSYFPGDPDVTPAIKAPGVSGLQSGNQALLTYSTPEVSPGIWSLVPDEIGPYGAVGGAKTVNAQANLSVVTRSFDTTFTTATGDLWPGLTLNVAPTSAFNPLYLTAAGTGATNCGTVAVSIKPTAAVGSVVTGTLFLDDYVLGSNIPNTTFIPSNFGLGILPSGDQLVGIPYTYTVAP